MFCQLKSGARLNWLPVGPGADTKGFFNGSQQTIQSMTSSQTVCKADVCLSEDISERTVGGSEKATRLSKY